MVQSSAPKQGRWVKRLVIGAPSTYIVAHLCLTLVGSTTPAAYQAISEVTRGWWTAATVVFFWLPALALGVHAFKRAARELKQPSTRGWAALMLLAGGLAGIFVVVHAWQMSAPPLLGEMEPIGVFYALCASLSATWNGMPMHALGYLLGGAATVSFFAGVGFQTLDPGWSEKPYRRGGFVVLSFCVYLLLAGSVARYAAGGLLP